MFMPTLFRRNNDIFDPFDDFFDFGFDHRQSGLMKSDVKETDNGYELMMDLPGATKDDVKIQLKDGVLNVEATAKKSNEEKDENGKYLRKERFEGSCSRSFYVGDDVKEDDIKAKFENGVLTVDFPKVQPKEEIPETEYIQIEG
ncbi:MAG TPA: Hsp20/alpha crystallin family protein [Eubacterium sp.]|nr:Hsp20/alpha crystallin family protein [uncultured Eubacterium sp.]HAT82667.1 Hsp20/alpha crystallin family protein [Eubacterium sp.]